MSKIDTIFFDWGGVVANDPGDDFLGQLLKNVGATDKQIAAIFETYMKRFMRGQITEQEYWQEIKSNFGLSIPDTISDEFMKWNGLTANQDVLDLISELKQSGLKVAILSNVIEPTYNVLKKAGYYDLFNETIASCKVGFAKPEREIYQISLDKLSTTADKSLFIDDKQRNLDPASQMGFSVILAENPEQIIRDVKKKLAR
jgi:putative hydrolase of the HAD superfamily